MKKLLAKKSKISAVFASNDSLAAGAIEAVSASSLRVPEDISVIGFDDMLIAQHTVPSLTTMRVPRFEMGCYAVRRLLEIIANPNQVQTRTLVIPRIKVRNSCRSL